MHLTQIFKNKLCREVQCFIEDFFKLIKMKDLKKMKFTQVAATTLLLAFNNYVYFTTNAEEIR